MINLAKKDLKENTLIKSLFKLDVKIFFRKSMMIKSIQIEIHFGIRHNQQAPGTRGGPGGPGPP